MSNQTNLKGLAVMVVIMITLAATVLIGSAIIGGFSRSVRTTTDVAIADFNMSLVGSTSSLSAYEFPQSLTGCFKANESAVTLTSGTDYTISEGLEETSGTFSLLNGAYNNTGVNCTKLTYLEDSTAQKTADLFNIALIVFATFMGILTLSIVGKAILNIFKED